jgi:sulfur carrier protein ThiS
MKVLYLNNDGGGFADYVNVDENTSVEIFFKQKLPESQSEDYLIRVNRQPVSKDYMLQDGDRISITPTKIDGAIQI